MTLAGSSGAAVTLLAALAFAQTAAAAPGKVRITDLGDLALGQWAGRGGIAAEDWHCVHVIGGPKPRTFRLEAFGSGPGGDFELRNGGARLDYTVAYDDGRGLRPFRRPGASLDGLHGSGTGAEYNGCRRGDRAQRNRVRVEVGEAELARAPAGRFRGTLLLMVVPE